MASSPGKRIRARWDMGIDGWKADDDDHEASERGGIIQTERGGREERGGFVTDLLEAVLLSRCDSGGFFGRELELHNAC